MAKGAVTVSFALSVLTPQLASAQSSPAAPKAESTKCIEPAAEFHHVNASILQAILKVESSYNAKAVNRNENGSIDVGIGQMNSIHFKELSKHGVSPADLMDACIGTYVSGWHLAKQLKIYGNTWFAIGAYHSATPYFNNRYQALVFNALVDMKVRQGPKLPVPSINPNGYSLARASVRQPPANASDILAISQ